ncbi:MAG: hypothetical protein QOH21_2522 [Acidobacteriota bacterium]|jgi:hypothetical protein|nr:hypothetical protein [Acidobacteriota bacterium]
MTPEFPIRIISDDGDCSVIDSPDDLLAQIDSLDSTTPDSRLWVRDALDRTVRLRMRSGVVEVLEV